MNSYALVVLVATAAVFGHGHARASSSLVVTAELDNQAVTATECPHKVVPGTNDTVPFIMTTKLKDCFQPSNAFNRKLASASDTDTYRSVFRSACTQVPAVRSCISAVDADAGSCLAETERKVWSTVVDFLDVCVTATCADDGELVATMFGDEFRSMTVGNQLRVLSCLYATASQTMFDRETDMAGYTLGKYRAAKSCKQCILNVAKHGNTASNKFDHFMDTITRSMKCLTPVTNEIVLCDTLDAGHDNSDENE